ncbi:TIGR04255 family protein [Paraburkholderia phenazinium]|uniref:TIGR04255 family protein n=2 Tax=Paraburkholderia phenazinium TaxID=60549 RepID=A0A1N6EFX4_9BURK|nr:TIGR04255 family protein [Paraburkholderia phenazinium]
MGIIYKNPSLVEVICELHWELTPVAIPPNMGVDPFLDVIRADLTPRLNAAGFVNSQELAHPQVPRQFLAWQPIVRFAPAPDTWPKIQLGPGIFTVNMAGPNYTGWPDFQPAVDSAVGALIESFPTPEKFLRLKSLQLKYLNAFTNKHDYQTYAQFASTYLGLKSVLPSAFIERIGVTAAEISTNSQTKLPISTPSDSYITVQVSEGLVNQTPGCVLQLAVEKTSKTEPKQIMPWFREANIAAREAFQSLATPRLIELMRPEEKR